METLKTNAVMSKDNDMKITVVDNISLSSLWLSISHVALNCALVYLFEETEF